MPMINIALIERNTIHRESLSTLLGQIDGLQVVIESGDGAWIRGFSGPPIHLLILDGSFGREICTDMIKQSSSLGMKVKALILVMFREELTHDYESGWVMLKSSGKSELASAINHIMADYKAEPLTQIW